MCKSRRELSNEYLLAKIGLDTAEKSLVKFARSPCTETQSGSLLLAFCEFSFGPVIIITDPPGIHSRSAVHRRLKPDGGS